MKRKRVQRLLVGAACAVMAFSQMPATMYVEADEPDYEVITDENGNPIDLGGMQIVLKDWWSDPEAEPNNQYEEDLAKYRQWAMETYNFTMVQSGDYGWGDCIQKLSEYAKTNDDGKNYLFTVRSDPSLMNAICNGYCYDLSTLDCLDFSDKKYAQNMISDQYTVGKGIYGMAAGYSEPRDGFFVNKNLLEGTGVTMDQIYDMQKNGTWTWDAFEDICKKVRRDTDGDGETDIWAWTGNTGSFTSDLVFSNGGCFVGINDSGYTYEVESPKTVAALEKANYFIANYRMVDPMIKDAETGEFMNAPWDYFYTAFKNGKSVFMYDGAYAGYMSGQIGGVTDFEMGFVLCPKGPDGELVTSRGNNPIVIPGNYDADKAWKIAFAYDVWSDAPKGYENYNPYRSTWSSGIFDERAINETLEIASSVGHGFISYSNLIPDFEINPNVIWKIDGTANLNDIFANCREDLKASINDINASVSKLIAKQNKQNKKEKIDYAKYIEKTPEGTDLLYRLYNPNSGEHIYTKKTAEVDNAYYAGWNFEAVAWYTPQDPEAGKPVYRLYNENGGEHHYTTDAHEKDVLVSLGWNYEDIAWYASEKGDGVPVYRLYNPNQYSNNHHFTLDENERNTLVKLGWEDEDVAFYAIPVE